MKQPHTEGAVDHTDGEQNTGNHRVGQASPATPGGTRVGADNVEQPSANTDSKTNVERIGEPGEQLDDSVSVNGPTERAPERDERGRL